MVALVSIHEVDFRLRMDLQPGDARSAGLASLIEDATGIVLDYLKTDGSQWSLEPDDGEGEDDAPSAVPAPVRAAIILVVRNLFDEVEEPLSSAVKALLHRYRDPALR